MLQGSQQRHKITPEANETSPMSFTDVLEIPGIVEKSRSVKQRCRDVSYRRQQLKFLYNMLTENESRFIEAMMLDLHKPPAETMIYELGFVKNDIVQALDMLDEWLLPERVSTMLIWQMDRCEVERVPLGSVLIIGTWNYPVVLTLAPLVAAIAGGNSAVVKMSEVSYHTGMLMAELMPKYLDPEAYIPVTGSVPQSTALLEHKYDLIFYTGNTQVAKIIMSAAAKHLTPVVLELGGKAPVIVDKNADLKSTAKRVMWGKSLNCGQTCMVPDHIFVHKDVAKQFVELLKVATKELYPEGYDGSQNYGRIVSDRHFERLTNVLNEQLKVPGTEIAMGGNSKPSERFMDVTILTGVTADREKNPVMRDEIFGPILPVIEYEHLDEVIKFVNSGSNPLSIYPQSRDKKFIDKVFNETNAGNALSNDVIVNFVVDNIPFGGTGDSGMGAYHGRFGFETFTRPQARMRRYTPEVMVEPRYQNFGYDMKTVKFTILQTFFSYNMPSEASMALKRFVRSLLRFFGGARLVFGLLLGLLVGLLVGYFAIKK
ncbi:Aldehyde/histidinol dehydrogenase [Gorgonomyces haynaldii]|nr:Aldehyde/histidinol dehydrogenase [Gorgonomyces haynaldii]